MNRIYLKQNGGAMTVNPNLRLNPTVFTSYSNAAINCNNNLIGVNDINHTPINLKLNENMINSPTPKKDGSNNGNQSMKTDGSIQSGNNNRNNNNNNSLQQKPAGETSSHSPSHSDSSTASAITPISPQQQNQQNTRNNQQLQRNNTNIIPNNNPLPIPLIPQLNNNNSNNNNNNNRNNVLPPPIPFGISTVENNSSTTSSASTNSSLPTPLATPITTLPLNSRNGNNGNNGNITPITPNIANMNHNMNQMNVATPNNNNSVNSPMQTNMNNGMVQLTSTQYGQLISKIDQLENTQLQQRQVIACLAGKLQDLEYKNQNNLSQIQHVPNMNGSLPQLPPMMNATPNTVKGYILCVVYYENLFLKFTRLQIII